MCGRRAEQVAAVEREPWLNVEQACEHLACSRHRIYRLVSMRRIPFAKEGDRLLFKRSALDEWVSNGGAGGER